MQPLRVLFLALVILLPAAPIATADWRSGVHDGNAEPNTDWDVPSRNFPDPNSAAIDRIYFDVVMNTFFAPLVPHPNPSGFATRGYGLTYFQAFLGYWRDCNEDAFIGDALTGAASYAATGIENADLCPQGSAYNDGVFVSEFLLIGRNGDNEEGDALPAEAKLVLCDTAGAVCTRGGWNFIRDDAANVWHDWNLPTDLPGATRLLLPFPQGTLTDTNGHFQYVDSFTFGGFSASAGVDCMLASGENELCWLWPSRQASLDEDGAGGDRARAAPNQCDEDDAVNGLVTGIQSLPDAPSDCPDGTSPIPNVPDPVTATVRDRYNDSTSQRFNAGPSGTVLVKPWDYGARGDRDPANDKCDLRTDPTAMELNPNGAAYPTLDHVFRGAVHSCSGDPSTQAPSAYSNLEYPAVPADIAGKVAADDPGFFFGIDSHFNPSDTLGAADVEVCAPTNAAVSDHPLRCGGSWLGSFIWVEDAGVLSVNPLPFETAVATFYADVSFGCASPFPADRCNVVDPDGNALVAHDPTTALPGRRNNAHIYGEENCPVGRGTVETGTWACDPLAWIAAAQLDPADPEAAEAIYLLPRPGKGYDLRDVDCYDNAVADTSINGIVGDATNGAQGDPTCEDLAPPVFV